jgi:hypothetical protein
MTPSNSEHRDVADRIYAQRARQRNGDDQDD